MDSTSPLLSSEVLTVLTRATTALGTTAMFMIRAVVSLIHNGPTMQRSCAVASMVDCTTGALTTTSAGFLVSAFIALVMTVGAGCYGGIW